MSTNAFDRQSVLSIVVPLTPANSGAANSVKAKLPHGALVTNVDLLTATAFNTDGTTPVATATITDGTTVFVNAQSVLNTGDETVAVEKKYYPTGGEITFSIAESAASGLVAATAGLSIAVVHYVQVGRGGDVQG